MKKIKNIQSLIVRNVYGALAAQLLLVGFLSIFAYAQASAATGQLGSRSVTLSDSGVSGGTITSGVGSGTGVSYSFKFNASSAATVAGVAIDFCSNTALFWDTCNAPTGLNVNRGTVTVTNQTNWGSGAFTVYGTGSNNNALVISRAAAAAPSGTQTFDLNGITNPSTLGSFYVRIYTYDTQAHAQAHVPTTTTDDGFVRDYGGVAVSTANVITITARVQENITFCVSAASPTSNCGGTSTPAVTIGHTSGGVTKFIDSSNIDTGSAYTQISTNAGSGATIRMHNSNSCGGLSGDSGTTCSIPPAGSGAATPAALTAGTAAFGLFVATSTNTGGSGTVTPDANYNDGTSTHYAMDSTTSGANVTTTYGDAIASCTAPVSNVNNQLTFAATASNVTPAGLYSANIALVATGVF